MSATVSRGIESFALWPPPTRRRRIESERLGPEVLAPPSLLPLGRWSEPRTRIVVAVNGGWPCPASAAFVASSTLELWICAEIRKTTSESASQPTIASATHLSARFHVIRLGGPSGPCWRSRPRKRARASPPRSKSRGRARYFVY